MRDNKVERPMNGRRPYKKPAFESSLAFERKALACSGTINQSYNPPFTNCSMQS